MGKDWLAPYCVAASAAAHLASEQEAHPHVAVAVLMVMRLAHLQAMGVGGIAAATVRRCGEP